MATSPLTSSAPLFYPFKYEPIVPGFETPPSPESSYNKIFYVHHRRRGKAGTTTDPSTSEDVCAKRNKHKRWRGLILFATQPCGHIPCVKIISCGSRCHVNNAMAWLRICYKCALQTAPRRAISVP